ncbi:MAG: hypothetical protein ACD_3C00004G0001 [uncultured bacterium (gcode 4)]|uniref:Uncharacterized protein n=1 Tax=uncultured bacterium (gcode 4) TaxID=1234023 RepID=K2G0R5_9BACT|nr:MAG: hypothetical protein ACD_3C00004G0001 [uncultured bacterium (gcode 4)]
MTLRQTHREKFPGRREILQEIWESFELSELQRTRKELVALILNWNI